ncbi:MAG: plastocyanin/azurin family copper-binding protein [Actinomycetota bacterium]
MRRLLISLASFAIIAVACSDDADESTDVAPPSTTTTEAPADDTPDASPDPADDDEPAELPEDYFDGLGDQVEAADDASLPEIDPDSTAGVYGFSRYVYQRAPGDLILPSLIEGPQGFQTRCQEVDNDCSYLELKALYDSGEPVPDYLRMDRDTLGDLVGQLDETAAYLATFENINDACARGMFRSSGQSPNMGIHMYDVSAGNQFDPGHPQMVLFAQADAGGVDGRCEDGVWSGDGAAYLPVGVVFNIRQSEDHPDAFAGDLDNWHIHFNLCQGAGIGSVATQEDCEAAGGDWTGETRSWMMHAYVAPDYDAQGGVFAMFNPSIWPVVDPADLEDDRVVQNDDGAVAAPITNFDFGDIIVEAGETVRFNNADSVPHTVTAGSAFDPRLDDFDSGLLGTAETYDLTFDEAGSYDLFCVLHPEMTATVTVN